MPDAMTVRIKLMDSNAVLPVQRPGDSGADLHAIHTVVVQPGEILKCDFGLALELPDGYEAQIRGRSGLSSRGFTVVLGTIDSSYRGRIAGILHNTTRSTAWPVRVGDRVAQLVIAPVATVRFDATATLSETDRGTSGFGSSGLR